MAQVIWSFNAACDLQDIETYISEEAKAPLNAIRFIDSLIDHAETILAIHPYSGRDVLNSKTHPMISLKRSFLKDIVSFTILDLPQSK